MAEEPNYEGHEQSGFKHAILKDYLEEFAYKVGSRWDGITYIDGFAGPWESASANFSDTPFGIALRTLERVKNDLNTRGKSLRLRLYLNEKKPTDFARLETVVKYRRYQDTEIVTTNQPFEDAVPGIIRELDRSPRQFNLCLIDPKGWNGFSMETIAPLFNRRNVEVIVNLMTSFIARFVTLEQQADNFEKLLGNRETLDRLASEPSLEDRELVLVEEYMRSLREQCGFQHTCTATILKPDQGKTHYHLVFGTNDPRGIEVFKKHEEKSFPLQESKRATIAQKKRERAAGMSELFPAEQVHDSRFTNHLKERALAQLRGRLTALAAEKADWTYDELFCRLMRTPFLWQNELNDYLKDRARQGALEIEYGGANPNKRRIPGIRKNDRIHFLARSLN